MSGEHGYDSENGYRFYETQLVNKEQREHAYEIAKQHLEGDQLRETKRWINHKTRTHAELRQLLARWGEEMIMDSMHKDE